MPLIVTLLVVSTEKTKLYDVEGGVTFTTTVAPESGRNMIGAAGLEVEVRMRSESSVYVPPRMRYVMPPSGTPCAFNALTAALIVG